MAEEKTSILLSDVSVEGEVVEKDKIIVDAKITGDIKAEEIITHSKSNIIGNIKSKFASLGGKLKGNVNSDQITIKKTANIEGVLNQKTLSIQEGAQLKIKTAISIASNPSLRRIKNELKKGVKEDSIFKKIYNRSGYFCQ